MKSKRNPTLRPAILALGLSLLPAGRAGAQFILDYQNASRASSVGMLPGSLNFPSKLSGLPGSAEGQQAISEMNALFETVNDSAYILGAGDVLAIGLGSRNTAIQVNPEGFAVIDGIGPVRVGDMTLRQAKKALLDKIATAYKGERLFVTLAKAKRVQASIVGAVQMPGIYTMSAAAHLTDLLQAAQGFALNANKLINVVGKDGSSAAYDLDRYYLQNDMAQNPYIRAGDQIEVKEVDYDKPTLLMRENDMINAVQLKDGQSAYDAVSAYNSIKRRKVWDRIVVFEGEDTVADLGVKEARAYFPKPGQILDVKAYKPMVFVGGAVMRPANYEFNSNFNALDYIASAGIMSNTGSMSKIRIISPDGSERHGNSGRIKPGDHIIVPESKESRARDYIGLLASIASIVTSITLAVITLKN